MTSTRLSTSIQAVMDEVVGNYSNFQDVGIVVIGRNEGERLVRCLRSLKPWKLPTVYVDSGSTDDSVKVAGEAGARVVHLDLSLPFTAARARNAGFKELLDVHKKIKYVQFIDGDCALDRKWLPAARSFMIKHPDVAITGGRRREIHPDASVYNWLCDVEWDSPVGEAAFCGGDTLMSVKALNETGGFRNDLLAGEEPELCIRLRDRGWRIWRLDEEMTLHDAAITRFSQWWRRCVRAGYGMADVAWLHRNSRNVLWKKDSARAVVYGGLIPAVMALGIVYPILLLAGLAYPVSFLRVARRGPGDWRSASAFAAFNTLAKFPQFLGVLRFVFDSLMRRRRQIIEYK